MENLRLHTPTGWLIIKETMVLYSNYTFGLVDYRKSSTKIVGLLRVAQGQISTVGRMQERLKK